MTTASKITLARVALIPIYMWMMYMSGGVAGPWMFGALGVFIFASATDFVDGYIARHYNQVSDFGKFLDPLADKLLVTAAMLIFVQWGRMPAWAVMIVLAREFAVSGLRMVAATGGKVLAAGWSGNVKTFTTMVGLCVMMVISVVWLDWAIIAIIVGTTLYSGIEYFAQNWNVIKP